MTRHLLPLIVALPLVGLSTLSCKKVPQAGSRDSGQSKLMDDSFAAQNSCNPKNHLRPFIIEWDATDMSSFESHAANDVVVVKYEGCELRVLDECRNDSIRGSQGSYKTPEWTSGSLEKLEIANSAELYAKLPLGAASLGARVGGGEKFAMEYYVAGTTNATRDAVYRAELDANPGCAGATHFVYGYNLGAFALGSVSEFNVEAGGSIYGFGAGGKTSNKRQADKKGGDLGLCYSDSAKEVQGCKAPIRLSLREIREGENPDAQALSAPETDASLNAAGQISEKMEMSDAARGHLEAATAKMQSKDGNGCLAELDKHDKLDAKYKSTDPKSPFALTRAQCLMSAGKCDAGKALWRKNYQQHASTIGPEQIERTVEAMAGMHCQGRMSDRDEVLKALMTLQNGAYMTKKPVKECSDAYETVKKLKDKVKPKDEEDSQIVSIPTTLYSMAPNCFARAGDCKKAKAVFIENFPKASTENVKDQATKDTIINTSFESLVTKCKAKK